MILRKTIATVLASTAISALGLLATTVQAQTSTTTTAPPSIRTNVVTPARNIYALTNDNAIYVLTPTATQYSRLGRVDTGSGNLIGIDFRPADNNPNVVYGLDDLGVLYKITLNVNPITSTKVSTMSTRFTGGFDNLMDFNPVANALRVTGSNGQQNLAVVNGADGSSLSSTVAQTSFAYATGDVNFGKVPQISGGAYSNNFVGATATIFYVVDHDLDILATIATKTATGSSNTAGGQLQTIGRFVDEAGNQLNMAPETDFDIYTDSTGKNFLVGQTKRLLFSIDLSQINPNLAVGQTQNVVVKRGVPGVQLVRGDQHLSGGIIDIAIPPRPAS